MLSKIIRCGLIAFIVIVFGLFALSAIADDNNTGRIVSTTTRVQSAADEFVDVQGAFEITGTAREWFDLYCLVRLDANTVLRQPDGKDFLRKWPGTIYMPDENKGRWSGATIRLDFADLETATNLPKGKRTALWATMDLYHAKKWVSNGWTSAAPFIVTTDNEGIIQKVETFNTSPALEPTQFSGKTKTASACEMLTMNLALKPGASLSKITGLKGEDRFVLVGDGLYSELGNGGKPGQFFAPIDSREKAVELVMLQLNGGRLIKTNAQYKAIMAALNKAKFVTDANFVKYADRQIGGFQVQEEPGIGYRVSALVEFEGTGIFLYRYNIGIDGRDLRTDEQIIKSPEVSNPLVPTPPNPLIAAIEEPDILKKFDAAMKSAMTAEGVEKITPLFKVTDRKVEIPDVP